MDSTTQPSQEDSQAGQEVVLLLTADGGDYFRTANRVLAAQAAGFAFSNTRPTTLALLSDDTREDIAVMEVSGFKEAIAELSTIVIRMNPYTCPTDYQAGTRCAQSVAKFARLMCARICDEAGTELPAPALTAIGEEMDAVIQARRSGERNAAPRITMPDGTVRIDIHGLSFIAEYRTKRGRHLRTVYFDVPALDWYDGKIRGLQIAAEFMEFMRTHHQKRYWYDDVLIDAAKAVQRGDGSARKLSCGSAARAFLDVIVDYAALGARHSEFGPWIAARIEQARDDQARMAQADADEKRAFVERMKLARQRKAEAKAQPAAARVSSTTKTARPAARKVEAVAA